MKKSIFILALVLCTISIARAAANNSSANFINMFSKCTKFVNNNERRISTVLGWSNRRCYYREISHKENLVCGFKILELEEVSNAMRKENFDHKKGLTSLVGVQKFLLMPEVCQVDKREEKQY